MEGNSNFAISNFAAGASMLSGSSELSQEIASLQGNAMSTFAGAGGAGLSRAFSAFALGNEGPDPIESPLSSLGSITTSIVVPREFSLARDTASIGAALLKEMFLVYPFVQDKVVDSVRFFISLLQIHDIHSY